jgi:hypothetical protein
MTPEELALRRLTGTPLAPLAPVSLAQAMPEAEGLATYSVPVRQEPSFDEVASRARSAGFGVDLARAGSMINEAFTGAAAPAQAYDELAERAQAPVRMFDARQRAEYEAALRDPFSPESQRRRAALERANPELAKSVGMGPDTSWADVEALAPVVARAGPLAARGVDQELRAKALGIQAEVEKRKASEFGQTLEQRKAEALQRAKDEAARQKIAWAGLSQREQEMMVDEEIARMRLDANKAERTAKSEREQRALNVPDTEIAPGATPTAQDAEAVKKVMTAEKGMKNGIARMRQLHKQYGTEKGGKGAMLLNQAMKGIQLEAKDIAGLGALSGPDQGLMESLGGDDPTTAWANVKGFFGVDNTEAALQGLEAWMDGKVRATLEARGYRLRAAQPTPRPAAQGAAPAPTQSPAIGPTRREVRKYSPSKDTTYVLDADTGEKIREIKGRAPNG